MLGYELGEGGHLRMTPTRCLLLGEHERPQMQHPMHKQLPNAVTGA